jgi:hypothetical protein
MLMRMHWEGARSGKNEIDPSGGFLNLSQWPPKASAPESEIQTRDLTPYLMSQHRCEQPFSGFGIGREMLWSFDSRQERCILRLWLIYYQVVVLASVSVDIS